MSDVLLDQMRAFRDLIEKKRDETLDLGLRVYLTVKLTDIEAEIVRWEARRTLPKPVRVARHRSMRRITA